MTPLLLALVLAPPPADPPLGEFARMFAAIVGGSKMGPGEGWFGPAKRRHDWPWLAAVHGLTPADRLPRDRFRGPAGAFAALDSDKDGALSAADFLPPKPKGPPPPAGKSPFANPADEPSTLTLLRGLLTSEIGSPSPGPALNSPAPDFSLRTVDGGRTVTLSGLVGPKPVVLLFGNLSCGPFRRLVPAVEELKQKYGEAVEFLAVYVREAHPTDGWRMASNDAKGVSVAQPRTLLERRTVAGRCAAELKMSMPLLVDAPDDRVGHLYSGMPGRLYLLDRAGRVAYQSGRGPFGFKPWELEQAINLLAVADELDKRPDADPLPPLADAAAWQALPDGTDKTGRLPGWARALAGPLPRTTAALIQLEQAVRVQSPLDAKLRAEVRWAAAHASGSDYGKVAALADLRRAGGSPADAVALAGDWSTLPDGKRTTLRFARKLALFGASVTDAEFEAVRRLHGDEATVGIVLVVAYSAFQDRLVRCLNTPAADGELPVPAVRFATPVTRGVAPPRVLPADPPAGPPAQVTDPDWLAVGADSLRQAMAAQAARPPRVRVPTFDEVKAKLPADAFPPGRTVKIRWSLAVLYHQPAVAQAWLNCLRVFGAESRQDRRFEESLFWVVTRSVDCFY